MKFAFVLLLALLALAAVATVSANEVEASEEAPVVIDEFSDLPAEFEAFLKVNKKNYATPAERLKRFNIWNANKARIEAAKAAKAAAGPVLRADANGNGIQDELEEDFNGPFGDLTAKEFESIYLPPFTRPSKKSLMETFGEAYAEGDRQEGEVFFETEADMEAAAEMEAEADAEAEAEVDAANSISWRKISSAVKDQGQCGSCWAFAATAVLESAAAKAKKGLKTLAPQQLVDCMRNNAYGCRGGDPLSALNFFTKSASEFESAYKYRGRQGSCRNPKGAGPKLKSAGFVCGGPSCKGKEPQIRDALRSYGPLLIVVNAKSWQHYKRGVIQGAGGSLNHAVVLVGYSNQGYWIVRNSWSTRWGEKGYIRLKYGKNSSGMAEWVLYATA